MYELKQRDPNDNQYYPDNKSPDNRLLLHAHHSDDMLDIPVYHELSELYPEMVNYRLHSSGAYVYDKRNNRKYYPMQDTVIFLPYFNAKGDPVKMKLRLRLLNQHFKESPMAHGKVIPHVHLVDEGFPDTVVTIDGRVWCIYAFRYSAKADNPNTNRYPEITLRRKDPTGKSIVKNFLVHRLVSKYFVPIPDHLKHIPLDKLQVNHKNGIKNDNRAENLEWCDSQANNNHKTAVLYDGKIHATHRRTKAQIAKAFILLKANMNLTAIADITGILKRKLMDMSSGRSYPEVAEALEYVPHNTGVKRNTADFSKYTEEEIVGMLSDDKVKEAVAKIKDIRGINNLVDGYS